MGATIHVERKPGGFGDRARKYMVVVDGQEKGKLKHGESLDVPIEAGAHQVNGRVDKLWRSEKLDLELAEGESATIRLSNRNLIALILFFFVFWRYIKVERLS